jgi:hypothetical protein
VAQTIRDRATRANARTAGIAAALVAAVLVVQTVVGTVVYAFGDLVYSGLGQASDVAGPLGGMVTSFGTTVLPVTLGVFLAFWCIVPLTAELRLMQVVLRSLIASAVVALVSLVFSSVFAAGGGYGFRSSTGLFGGSFPFPSAMDVAYAVFGTVQSVVSGFLYQTPLVMLVGVLVWLWGARPRQDASARP